MIRFTGKNGQVFYLAPELIERIEQSINGEDRAYVNGHYVTESPEEVARKVLDYKLSMVRYEAACQTAHNASKEKGKNPFEPPLYEVRIMERLAGLEDTP